MTGATRGKRRYRQESPLAAALDVVGERWTLLLVQELLSGPKRYGELLDALPGIGTNLLVNRLRDLADAGVVRRTTTAPPSSVVVYELTAVGSGLEPAVSSLTHWGETIKTPNSVKRRAQRRRAKRKPPDRVSSKAVTLRSTGPASLPNRWI